MKFDDNMAMKPIEIFLADDHGMMNAGLTALLQQEPDMEVRGIFTSAQQLLDRMPFDTPDLVISDISMPDMNGLELAKIIREKHPKVRIILLTMHASAAWVKQAKETGVQGYLLKESGLQEMRDAIHTVMNGEKYISSKAAVNLLKEEQEGTRITPRETEILQMLARGLTTKEIADAVFVSTTTIDTHRKNLLAKTGVANTAELIVWAMTEGYLPAGKQ